MFSELTPSYIGQAYNHPQFPLCDDTSPSSDTFPYKGGFFKKNNFWWKFRGPHLVVFEWSGESFGVSREPRRVSSFDFSRLFEDASIHITSVSGLWDKFFATENSDHAFTLLVALDRESPGSILCMVDTRARKILKSIDCPFKISCMECISAYNRTGPNLLIATEELMIMSGIVAVGSPGGLVFLIDLCLDQQNDEASAEVLPSNKITFIVKQNSFNNTTNYDLSAKRKSALVNDQHICFPLNKESQQKGKFLYRSEESMVLGSFKTSDVTVTAVKFVPQTNTIYAGFNFGGFQFWNLKSLKLECSCELEPDLPPIIGFMFQEPENDPKSFCYIWVTRGMDSGDYALRAANGNADVPLSSALLYGVEYGKKEWVPGHGYLYSDFLSSICKFEYQMGISPYLAVAAGTTSSCIISCNTIEQGYLYPYKSSDDENNTQDLSLCFLSWEAWDESSNITSCVYIAIFDLNQWYQTQMPSFVEVPSHGTSFCPYLGLFSLTDVATSSSPDTILSLRLTPKSLSKFRREADSNELLYYPSSLSFSVQVLSETQVIMTSFLGLQKRCLSQLETAGPDILIDPKKFLSNCSLSGLIPSEEALSSSSIESKRKAILSLALKYGQLSFLVNVIEHWASGEWSKLGCDCRFFLGWVWEEVCRFKRAIDESTTCLFDGSGHSLDEATYATLFGYESALKSLGLLIKRLILQGTATTEEGHHELEMRREATDLIAMYLKIILWLYRSGLLPESSYDDENETEEEENPDVLESRIYPRSLLSRTYDEWRRELHSINPSVIGLTDILLIDGITKHLKDQITTIWEEEGGSKDALYPPPTIHALVRVYLLESVPLELKHTVMLYFLMDIASYVCQKRSDIEERIKLFPSYFNLKLGVSKLVEGIWAIDNKFFDFGLSALSFPQVQGLLVNAEVEDPGQRNLRDNLQKRLVTSLLYQDRHKDALKLVRSFGLFEIDSPEKERLYVSILARNRQLFQAFMFQRSCRNKQNAEEILMHFYLACEQMNLISQLFQLPLDSVEEEGLIYYLFNISSSRDAKHLLILYLLLKGKVIEAHQFRESYREELELTQDDELFQRGMHLSALIDSYMANLPKSLTKLADEINAFEMARLRDQTPSQASQLKRTEKPQPPPTPKIKTQPDTILKLIEEMEEIYREAETGQKRIKEPTTPFREKIKQKGLLLTRDSPFIRAPFHKDTDMGLGGSPLRSHATFGDEERERDTSFRSMSSLRKDRRTGEESFLTPTKPLKTKTKVPFTSSEISMLLRTPPVKSASKVKSKSIPSRDDSCFTPISILKVKNTSESSNILSLPSPTSQRTRKSVSMQESSLTFEIPPPSSSTFTESIENTTLTQSIIEASRAETELDESNFAARLYKDTFELKFGGEVAGGGEITASDITSDTITGDDNLSISSKKDVTMSSEAGSTTTDEDHHSRKGRSKKPKDANPSHPMQLRASSAKKKPSSKK